MSVAAWTLRAVCGSVLFPIAVGLVVSHLSQGGQGIPVFALLCLVLSLITGVATEWVFQPYNYLFVRHITDLRKNLAEAIVSKKREPQGSQQELDDDVIGKITSDVDFVMWNLSGVIATVVPNLLTVSFGILTIASANSLMAVVSLVVLPVYFVVVRKYSQDVYLVRMQERQEFSRMIKISGDIVEGIQSNTAFDDTLTKWNKAWYRQIFIDRVYWTYAWFFMGFGPILLLAIGAYLVGQSALTVGSLVTAVLAANGVYGPLAGTGWGFAMLSQIVPPTMRIQEALKQE